MVKKYLWNIVVSLDQFLNTLLGGDPDMTISGRIGRWYPDSWMDHVIDFYFGKNHCEEQSIIESDEGKDRIIN